jgi:hypothetical protein
LAAPDLLAKKFGMKIFFPALILGFVLALSTVTAGENRTWTDAKGNTLAAEYLESTSQTVTLRTPDLRNIKVKIGDLSEVDRKYIADLKEKERQANLITPIIKGEIVVRINNWSSLGWSNTQSAELWEWDAETQEPSTKIGDVEVEYFLNHGNRDQYEGKFVTLEPVTVDKSARIIVKAKFQVTHDGERKLIEDNSAPVQLPQMNADGEIKLPTVRATLN